MTWPSFYFLGGAWLFLLIGPLVLLYFLKLRRSRQAVPSLVLWRQVLQDQRVNSPFQKFKRNLLLLLQLLLLCAIILAAMQPYLRGDAAAGERRLILIDHSASMGALDRPGGATRLDAARQQARRLIDGLRGDQQIALISFSRTARKLTDFTSDKRALRAALDQLAVEDVAAEVEEALRMAAAMGQREPFDQGLLLSDGNFPGRSGVALPFELEYQKLDAAGPNFGITELSARRAGHQQWEVFVVLAGSRNIADAPATVGATLEVIQDGQSLMRESDLVLTQGESQRLAFTIAAADATWLELRLRTDGFDSLASDNVAYLDLEPARLLRVYAPPALVWHRLALASMPEVQLFPADGESGTSETVFDLIVSDAADDGLYARTRLYVDVVPEDVAHLLGTRDEVAQVIDWHRDEALLRYVQFSNLYFMPQPAWRGEPREAALEQLGYEVMMHGRFGPVMLRRRAGQERHYYQLFHVDRSTLDRQPVDFAIMVQNLVNIALGQADLAEARGWATGVLPALELEPARAYRVRSPRGTTWSGRSDARAMLWGVAAPHVGRYSIVEDTLSASAVASVGVSLLSPRETSLDAEPAITFEQQTVHAGADLLQSDHSYWRMLLAIALIIMLMEWWYFQRKPGGWGR